MAKVREQGEKNTVRMAAKRPGDESKDRAPLMAVREDAGRACLELLDELSASAGQEIMRHFPAFATLMREGGPNVRADIECTARAALGCLAERRDLLDVEAAELRRLGTRHAASRIPIRDATDSIDLVATAGFRLLTGLVRTQHDSTAVGDVLFELGVDAIGVVQAIRREVATGYDEHEDLALTHELDAKASFVWELLHRPGDPDSVAETATAFGIERYRAPFCLMLALPACEREGCTVARRAQQLAESVGGLCGPVRRTPGIHVPVIVPTGDVSRFSRQLQIPATRLSLLLYVEQATELGSLAVHYRRMRREIAVARVGGRSAGVVLPDDLAVHRVLADSAEPGDVFEFIRGELGAVLASPPMRANELVSTLEALHRHNGSVALAADHLGLSVAGVRDRVKRLRDNSQLRLNEPTARFRATLAALLFRLHEAELPAMGDSAWC